MQSEQESLNRHSRATLPRPALVQHRTGKHPPHPLFAHVAPTSRCCAPPCPNPALPPLEFTLQRRNRSDRRLQCGNVLMIVMPRHRRRFMPNNRLHDMERHSRVRREGYERMPERVKRRLGCQMMTSFKTDRRRDVRQAENPHCPFADPPLSRPVRFRKRRQNGTYGK